MARLAPSISEAMVDAESDAWIVARVLEGDVEAYAGIVARYHGSCLRHARRMLGDALDAEDAVQETFVRAYDALGRYEEQNRFGAWLFSILTNECRMLQAKRRRRERWIDVDDVAVMQAPAPAASDPDGSVTAVERALLGLEPLLREAFLLRHVQGMNYREMQHVTGARASALKMRVKRACEALRVLLGGRDGRAID